MQQPRRQQPHPNNISARHLHSTSRLRYDVLSGDWVLFVPKRFDPAKSYDFVTVPPQKVSATACPFDDPQAAGNKAPHFWLPVNQPLSQWRVQVLENKFPALEPLEAARHSFIAGADDLPGYGYHDLLIMRDHKKTLGSYSEERVGEVFEAIQQRVHDVMRDTRIYYSALFQNQGPLAGASIAHPHLQMISLPVVPRHIRHELLHAASFYTKHHTCFLCHEQTAHHATARTLYRDAHAIVSASYTSREPFELMVIPRVHSASFETASPDVMHGVVRALHDALHTLEEHGMTDYNWYVHTAPFHGLRSTQQRSYHWYIRIVPRFTRIGVDAGFELGTGIQENPILPKDAIAALRVVT